MQIGFVPTMGALHAGHLSLIEKSISENDITVASIFVNPAQFNESSDYNKYPRTPESDQKLLSDAGVDFLFAPSRDEIYGKGEIELLDFDFKGLDLTMEGKFRPGHFSGVVTIVDRLFNIVKPDKAYFGQKDFQQLAIIRLLAKSRHPYINIVACPTLREQGGLALSSRNELLTPEQRTQAVLISKTLFELAENWKKHPLTQIKDKAISNFAGSPLQLEYLEIADAETLQALSDYNEREAVACIAARLGDVRLIDNVLLPA